MSKVCGCCQRKLQRRQIRQGGKRGLFWCYGDYGLLLRCSMPWQNAARQSDYPMLCDPFSPSRDIATRYLAGQGMAERHNRELKPPPSKVAAPQTRHPAMHRSRYEVDLWSPQQYAAQVPWCL